MQVEANPIVAWPFSCADSNDFRGSTSPSVARSDSVTCNSGSNLAGREELFANKLFVSMEAMCMSAIAAEEWTACLLDAFLPLGRSSSCCWLGWTSSKCFRNEVVRASKSRLDSFAPSGAWLLIFDARDLKPRATAEPFMPDYEWRAGGASSKIESSVSRQSEDAQAPPKHL